MNDMEYRQKLQQIASASGLSQQALAEKLGVSFVSINNWLNGKTEPTRSELLHQIDLLYVEYVGGSEIDKAALRNLKQQAVKTKLTAKKLIANRELLLGLTVNLTYHTNTIEGSTMTESDVEKVLYNDQILKNRTQVEQREAINHRVALEFLLDELAANKTLNYTPELIQRIHLLLMNGIISDAGNWRNHSVRIQGSHVPLANFIKIPSLIDTLCTELNSETTDPIAVLARTHAAFEQIHPFSDGNGRTGRLIMFAQALQYGLFPPIVPKERKQVYYKYLEEAQTKQSYDLLEQFIAETVISSSEKQTKIRS